MRKLTLHLAPHIDELARLHDSIAQIGRQENWSVAMQYQVDLALDELVTNIVNYGHTGDRPSAIDILLTAKADAVTIEVSDDGRAFDLLHDAPEPDLESPVESRPLGGLGVHLVRTFMDEVTYRRDGNINHLVMVKKRTE